MSQPDYPAQSTLSPSDQGYPVAVSRLLGSKAPAPLHCMGNLALLSRPAVGFCGSRKASERGIAVADDCARQLVQGGFVVASGNAAGVDHAAHKAALEAGGQTILVLPEGLDHFRIRKTLAGVWDWERVLVVSQFAPSAVWQTYRAMERNSLLIALSRAMIVIEAGATGGTLHAGKSTLKMGLPLFVIEYGDMKTEAPGNAELIAAGGRPVLKRQSSGLANVEGIKSAAKAPVTAVTMQVGALPLALATP